MVSQTELHPSEPSSNNLLLPILTDDFVRNRRLQHYQ
nr:MAG TPA: hypothetical protein [Caudoviricetes sp.]